MACTGFLIREGRLHIEFHTEHRSPGSEVLEQHHAAFCFADHDATAGLGAVSAANQLEAVNVITFGAARHVLNQLGVSSLLPFDLGKLPSDVVELHLFSKAKPPSSTKIAEVVQRRPRQYFEFPNRFLLLGVFPARQTPPNGEQGPQLSRTTPEARW